MPLFAKLTTQPVSLPLAAPVSFERFMGYCLYDPASGYYFGERQKVFGRSGDYFTSPHTHDVFARCLAQYFSTCFSRLGKPSPFHVCELGSGDGRLAAKVLSCVDTAFPELSGDIEYVEIDVDRGDLPQRIQGVVFSNEFFDSLPVHRVCLSDGELREVYVRQKGTRLEEVPGPLSDSRLANYLEEAFPRLREDWIYEVNLRMLDVVEQLDQRIGMGMILTIDYGYTAAEYEAMPRPDGTLACYYRHQVGNDPYRRVGEQDMTCHIHWDMLRGKGQALGWKNHPMIPQRDFLMRTGLKGHLLGEEAAGLLSSDRLEERLALKSLLYPGGVSDTLQVLVQEVRCPDPAIPASPGTETSAAAERRHTEVPE